MVSYVGAFLNPVVQWFSPPPLPIPDECKSLIERLNGLTTFSQFNNPYPGQFVENREIVLGEGGNDQILIKKPPCSKNFYVRSYMAKQEQLAYLISERLGLNVVPAAVAIEGFNQEIDKVSETVRKRLLCGSGEDRYQGVVIQKKVNAHAHLTLERLDEMESRAVFRIISWSLSWFRNASFSLSLNQKQLSKAVLFNIVAGRTDARRDNSMIDSTGKVMEIDNEYLGRDKTSSWLFGAFSNHILCKDVIDAFLEKDSSIIEDIFKDFGRRYSRKPFWCPVDGQYNSIDQSKTNILNNFKRLQAFLKENRDSVIRIRDLKEFCAR